MRIHSDHTQRADGPFQPWGKKALRQATPEDVRNAGLEFVGGNPYRGKLTKKIKKRCLQDV